MKTIKHHTLMTTQQDSQGERYDKEFLSDIVSRLPARCPLGQLHDLALPSRGYIESFSLEELPGQPGEWQIVGDVHLEEGQNFSDCGGFSFSKTEVVRKQDGALGALYVPYPFYRDETVLSEILSYDPQLNAGKWIKKSADPVTIALIALFAQPVYFFLTPIWRTTWEEMVWPFLRRTVAHYREGRLRNNTLDYGFVIKGHRGEKTNVYFASDRSPGASGHSKQQLEDGLQRAIAFATADAKAKTGSSEKFLSGA